MPVCSWEEGVIYQTQVHLQLSYAYVALQTPVLAKNAHYIDLARKQSPRNLIALAQALVSLVWLRQGPSSRVPLVPRVSS